MVHAMAHERLLRLCISILRRFVQLPLRSLLWLLSKLRRVVNLGRRPLQSSEISSKGYKDLSCHGSFFCASEQPPPRGAAGELQGLSLEMTHIPDSAALSIQPTEPNPSQPHDLDSGPFQVPRSSTADTVVPNSEKFEQDLGFLRPHLCMEVENLLAIAPTEYQRYDRNEVVCV